MPRMTGTKYTKNNSPMPSGEYNRNLQNEVCKIKLEWITYVHISVTRIKNKLNKLKTNVLELIVAANSLILLL